MKTRIAAVAPAFALSVAPISSASAYDAGGRSTGFAPFEAPAAPFGVEDTPRSGAGPMRSAAGGNADPQIRPVEQDGRTAGGSRG